MLQNALFRINNTSHFLNLFCHIHLQNSSSFSFGITIFSEGCMKKRGSKNYGDGDRIMAYTKFMCGKKFVDDHLEVNHSSEATKYPRILLHLSGNKAVELQKLKLKGKSDTNISCLYHHLKRENHVTRHERSNVCDRIYSRLWTKSPALKRILLGLR